MPRIDHIRRRVIMFGKKKYCPEKLEKFIKDMEKFNRKEVGFSRTGFSLFFS